MSKPSKESNNGPEGPEHPHENSNRSGRRTFLKMGTLAGAGLAAGSSETKGAGGMQPDGTTPIPQDEGTVDPAEMPMTRIGDMPVSRLVVGANPMTGYSHRGELLGRLMMEYYTPQQVVNVLRYCETRGINTWQTSFSSRHPNLENHYDRVFQSWEMLQESGSKMNVIVLVTPRDWENAKAWDLLLKMKPKALIHHGHPNAPR